MDKFKNLFRWLSSLLSNPTNNTPEPETLDIGFPARPKSPGELKREGILNPKRTRISRKKRLGMESKIDELLDYAESFRYKKKVKGAGAKGFNVQIFSGAEPFCFDENDSVEDVLRSSDSGDDDEFISPQYMHPRYAPENWQTILLHPGREGFYPHFSKISAVSFKELRGNGGQPSMYNCCEQILAETKGRVQFFKSYYSFVNGKWIRNNIKIRTNSAFHPEDHMRIQMHVSFAFLRQFQWKVAVGFENGLVLSFATDPVGALNAFRLREKPEGKSRRDPLKHWVKEHHRASTRIDKKEETKIRQHLRGKTDFFWNGLSVSILVCPWDLNLAQQLKKKKQEQIFEVEPPEHIKKIEEKKDISFSRKGDVIPREINTEPKQILPGGVKKAKVKLKKRYHPRTGAKI